MAPQKKKPFMKIWRSDDLIFRLVDKYKIHEVTDKREKGSLHYFIFYWFTFLRQVLNFLGRRYDALTVEFNKILSKERIGWKDFTKKQIRKRINNKNEKHLRREYKKKQRIEKSKKSNQPQQQENQDFIESESESLDEDEENETESVRSMPLKNMPSFL